MDRMTYGAKSTNAYYADAYYARQEALARALEWARGVDCDATQIVDAAHEFEEYLKHGASA